MMAMDKQCMKCGHVKRFYATDGEWMDVCTAQELEDIEEGFSHVSVVDKEVFDATSCLDFKKDSPLER